jgi:predicted esterase
MFFAGKLPRYRRAKSQHYSLSHLFALTFIRDRKKEKRNFMQTKLADSFHAHLGRVILMFIGTIPVLATSTSAQVDSKATEIVSGKDLVAYATSLASDKRLTLSALDAYSTFTLTAEQSKKIHGLVVESLRKSIVETRKPEFEAKELRQGEFAMKFEYKVFGEKPEGGRSLYISMHGGGGAPKRVNDGQWQNQIRLYEPKEGVYVAPRAPTDTWNLWHQDHIDPLFIRLIENMVLFEEVNPDRVYLLGYSAGGDGVYQLAPRMADRLAAASMMAGHPNETEPFGLRNLPFALFMGGNDSAYQRNAVAEKWSKQLDELEAKDPGGYKHLVKIYPNKGHWMDRQDAEGLPWMAQFTRQGWPKKVVWKQDDVVHQRFYWLEVAPDQAKGGTLLTAEVVGQEIRLSGSDLNGIILNLSDELLDLSQPIKVLWNDEVCLEGSVDRTVAAIQATYKYDLIPPSPAGARVEIVRKSQAADGESKPK